MSKNRNKREGKSEDSMERLRAGIKGRRELRRVA